MKSLCCSTEMAFFGHCDEVLKLGNAHGHAYPIWESLPSPIPKKYETARFARGKVRR